MNRLNNVLLWVFMASIGLFVVMFSLYVASILIPILLVIILVSGVANLVMFLYKNYQNGGQANNEQTKCKIPEGKKSNPEIIDAEYEVVDDK